MVLSYLAGHRAHLANSRNSLGNKHRRRIKTSSEQGECYTVCASCTILWHLVTLTSTRSFRNHEWKSPWLSSCNILATEDLYISAMTFLRKDFLMPLRYHNFENLTTQIVSRWDMTADNRGEWLCSAYYAGRRLLHLSAGNSYNISSF